jgi:hypothetical protein
LKRFEEKIVLQEFKIPGLNKGTNMRTTVTTFIHSVTQVMFEGTPLDVPGTFLKVW